MIVGSVELRQHLRVDAGDEDQLLELLAFAAEQQVSSWIDRPLYSSETDLPIATAPGYHPNQIVATEAIKAAILMMAARLYMNREGTGDGMEDASLPMSVRALLAPYRFFGCPPRAPEVPVVPEVPDEDL